MNYERGKLKVYSFLSTTCQISASAREFCTSVKAFDNAPSDRRVRPDLSSRASLTRLRSPPSRMGSHANSDSTKFNLYKKVFCPVLGAYTLTKVHFSFCKKPDKIIYLPFSSTFCFNSLNDILFAIRILTPLEAPLPGAEKTCH